jgi:hypothetical protein
MPEPAFHLAQLNIGYPLGPTDSPVMAEFMARLDPVNAVADATPGFVWRLQTDDGNATAVRAFDDDRLIVNMSLWESLEALRGFVYSNRAHLDVMRRRREWFERMEIYLVLWWVPAGHVPTVREAEERLDRLRALGPTPGAFTFRAHFPPPAAADDDAAEVVADDGWLCPTG